MTLNDVNESPPAFTMSVYSASLAEQSGADASVLDVSEELFSFFVFKDLVYAFSLFLF